MRIRHKILLGYVAIVGISVVLVGAFLVSLSGIKEGYASLLNRDQQVLLEANKLRYAVQRQMVASRTYEQLGDPSLLVEYNEASQAQQEAMNGIRKLVTQPDDLETLQKVETASVQYSAIARQAMALSQGGMPGAVVDLKRSEGEPARLFFVSQVEEFIDRESKELQDRQISLERDVDDLSSRLLLVTIVGVIATLAAASILTDGLTSPLRRLMRNIQGISQGDLQTAVAVRSHDEIGELAGVLETMRQRLARTAGENESLLQSAREEAEKLATARKDLVAANTELEQALATELEARRRIEEINRLKAEFTSMVSHELKTPVSYVYNYAGALKEHNESLNDSQRREFLVAIQSEAQHLLTLIDDIMAVSLLESGGLTHRFVQTDLRKIVDTVVKDQQLTTRRHTLTVKGPEAMPVLADPNRVKQVMNNLLSNAIKYSTQGGPVEVRLRANPADGMAIIYVRDYGLGIRAADVPKLFDRFTRIQRRETMAIPGSGLGLYIAHHIVQAHGGTLSLEPAPGKGTIAQATVPLWPGSFGSTKSAPVNEGTETLVELTPVAKSNGASGNGGGGGNGRSTSGTAHHLAEAETLSPITKANPVGAATHADTKPDTREVTRS